MKKNVAAALLAMVCSSAFAGGYVEASVGASHLNADCSGTVSCKNTDVAYKLVGGFYRVNPVLSVELGYLNFGKATQSGYPPSVPVLIKVDVQSEAPFVGLALRGELDSDIAGTVRLAVANSVNRTSVTGGYSERNSKVVPLFGLGVQYKVDANVSIVGGIDFTRSADVLGESGGSLRLLTAGARYSF